MFTRREIIQKAGILSALSFTDPFSSFLSKYAFADSPYIINSGEHLFLLIKIYGGMDATLGLDPQIMPTDADANDLFLEYRPEEILQAGDIRLGPAAKPLLPFAGESLIVNGVMMRRDAGHDVCLQYATTGRGDGKAAVISAELGLATGFGPFGLAMNASAYTAGKPVLLSSLADISNEAAAGSLSQSIEEKLKTFLPENTPIEEAQKAIVNAKATSEKLVKTLAELSATSGGKLTEAQILAAAFQSGAACHAVLDKFSFQMDTHQAHEKNHLQIQLKIWEEVAGVFSEFKKMPYKNGSLFDYTTFMVTSEFSRTPALNAAKGKDHNPMTNSILLAGKNIRGGTTVGKSRVIPRKKSQTGNPEHYAWPFNYKEGKLAEGPENASFFYPENVIQTMGKVFNNPSGFSPVASDVPIIPGISKV